MPEAPLAAISETRLESVCARTDFTGVQRVARQLLEAAFSEQLLDHVVAENVDGRHYETFYFSLQDDAYVCHGKQRQFGRVRLYLASMARIRAGRRVSLEQRDFAGILVGIVNSLPGDAAAIQKLLRELGQTVQWTQWNLDHLEHAPRRRLNCTQLETALHEGHPYHPCFKARSGFSQEDHRRYSCETGARFRLHWAAVPRNLAQIRLPDDPQKFYSREMPTRALHTLTERLLKQRGTTADYCFVPMHPWQRNNYLGHYFASGQLLDLGAAGDEYIASASLRTLINVTDVRAAHVKLPLDIVCTSSSRFLLKHGVGSAPAISRWLQDVVNSDAFFERNPLVILAEYASVSLDETLLIPDAQPDQCHLGAIWRESIESHLSGQEQAVPMTALYATETDGMPFINDWINEYGLEAWLQQLHQVVVLPLWHLLVRHGIALEVHAQNTLLVHRDGWPVRLAVRDFHESLEYVEDFLLEPHRVPDFRQLDPAYRDARPNQFYWMDSVAALREVYMDTLYVYHLSELAQLCEFVWNFSETRFWQQIDTLLRNYATHHPELASRITAIGHDEPRIKVESLLARKLKSPEHEHAHWVANPFYSFKAN